MSEKYQIKRASNFSKIDIKNFKKIVLSKGQVIENTFDGLIENNPVLLFYPNPDKIEAVGALKIPNKTYKEKIFTQSQSIENPDSYEFELGWIVSLKTKKGIGKLITRALSEYSSKIYAYC